MSKKKRKDAVTLENENQWNYNVFQDETPSDDQIPEGDICDCGGYLWRIDDYIVCGHCGKRWYPATIINDDD